MEYKKHLIKLGVVLAIVAVLVAIFWNKDTVAEKMEQVVNSALPQVATMNTEANLVDYSQTSPVTSHIVDPSDLLPNYSDANQFSKDKSVTDILKEQNFIVGGHDIGINTVGQSKRMAYLDIRSLPPVTKEDVGPFNNSPYDQTPGATRRHFEIGN